MATSTAVTTRSPEYGDDFMMATLRRLARRLAGRDGDKRPDARPASAPPAHVQRAKARRTDEAVAEAQAAVDDFTASVERAMRGTGGHFRLRGQ